MPPQYGSSKLSIINTLIAITLVSALVTSITQLRILDYFVYRIIKYILINVTHKL